MDLKLVFVLVALAAMFSTAMQAASPILFFPGIMGSRLEVKDTRSQCSTSNKFKDLWIDHRILQSCGIEELSLVEKGGTFENIPGVQIRPDGFGQTAEVEFLTDVGQFRAAGYLKLMVEYFVKHHGYVRGKSFAAAPYDWRLAADELENRGYYADVKHLIEEMYKNNKNTKVTLIAHSMGAIVSLHFLTSVVDQNWKNNFIHAYVPLGAAWSGGVEAAASMIKGMAMPGWVPSAIREGLSGKLLTAARTFESGPWLMPKPSVFGKAILIRTPKKTYTSSDYNELFTDIGEPQLYTTFQRVQFLNYNYPAPNVPTLCMYGINVPTPEVFTFAEDFNPKVKPVHKIKFTYTTGLGDGTVNQVSSNICLEWKKKMHHYAFKHKEFPGVNHLDIVKDTKVFAEIADLTGAARSKRVLTWNELRLLMKLIE